MNLSHCETCRHRSDARIKDGKRKLSIGTFFLNIVIDGDELHHGDLLHECPKCGYTLEPDILIVMGTSMQHGVKGMIEDLGKKIHQHALGKIIYINRSQEPLFQGWTEIIDEFIEMDCDRWDSSLKDQDPAILQQPENLSQTEKMARAKGKTQASRTPQIQAKTMAQREYLERAPR